MNIFEVDGKINKAKLAKDILIPVVGGMVTGFLATRNAKKIYSNLKKPDFSPPSWVFPVAWTTLYTLMGTAKNRVSMKEEPTKKAESLYDIQLGLNFLWSFLFFRWGLRGTAFTEICILLTSITLTTYKFFQKDKAAGAMMVPYVLWVSYALGLNYSTWQLNKS
ncbi:TspO/MBR family protein [Bacillus salacetis]|uniref:TspO/MBR family protein n=1 Tax=Bacillus salacetis TaxID=2315464 RepID=UPI003B9F3E1F